MPTQSTTARPDRARVLLLIRTLGVGGMERMTINLANALHRQGHEVHLLVFKRRIALKPEAGVQVHVADLERIFRFTVVGALYDVLIRSLTSALLPRARNVLYSTWFRPLFRLWLRVFERRHGPVDLMIARGYGSFQGLVGLRDPRLIRVVVNEVWESPEDTWDRRFFRGSFDGAKVVFNSSRVESDFRELCKEMGVTPALTRVINNPTDLAGIRHSAEGTAPVEGPFILNAGRLEASKNQQLLIDAFALLRDRIPHRLVIMGKGSLEARLRKQAEELGVADRVLFVGQHLNPYPWMRQAELFVLSSTHEGLPNVVIEALACGTPVVVTRGRGGAVELMRGDLTRFIAELDKTSLAEKMLLALEQRPEITLAAVDDFSMHAVARSFLALEPGIAGTAEAVTPSRLD